MPSNCAQRQAIAATPESAQIVTRWLASRGTEFDRLQTSWCNSSLQWVEQSRVTPLPMSEPVGVESCRTARACE
eukprot:6470067-Amphidinium_carterae.2